jgi:excisionase family DNA binding protein
MQVQVSGQVLDLASLALTTAEMALALKVSERTIQRRIAKKVIPVIDLGDGRRIPGAFLAFVLSEALRTGCGVLDVLGTAWTAAHTLGPREAVATS